MGTILFGIIGIISVAFASYNHEAGGALMLIVGILGFITASYFWIIAGLLPIAVDILAFRIPKDEKANTAVQQIPVKPEPVEMERSQQEKPK